MIDPEPSRRALLRLGAAAAVGGALPGGLGAQPAAPRSRVDAGGVWRWPDGREVALFGVNYDLASASAFRFAKASGVPFEQIVAADVAHFRRLGFNGLRLCFWGDWENTATDGHLVDNEHLAVLDLIVAEADEAGFGCLLSPFVTYDAAWPDAMERSRAGVSSAFKKDVLGTDPAAIVAQARYLGQLLVRVNPRTGRRYADEPALAAIEPINEPTHHAADRAGSVRYIDALARAVRDAGFAGPIVYNVTQDMAIAPAIAAAEVQGATFAWYPTGLQNGRAVAGNGLLLVDDYAQFHDPALAARAKLVYEFDAADSMASYFYPAMVREFRAGGAQFAAMFAYDALPIAAANSEFNDHFLNLCYTPAKAISALIAGVAMRELPRGRRYGAYPANMRFDGFRVDDRADLSEFADATRFFHSNTTDTSPPAPARLEQLAGCGSSPLVTYDGTGAWFLDRVAAGVWRLELYPDAALIDNPFTFRRPSRPAVRIVHRARTLTLRLPDLGPAFAVTRADGTPAARARDGAVTLTPGVYRLARAATALTVDPVFHAPPPDRFAPVLRHEPPAELVAGRPWTARVEIVAPDPPGAVALRVRRSDGGFASVALAAGHGFTYGGDVPAALLTPGFLDYYITVDGGDAARTTPSSDGARPGDWDFPRRGGYRVAVVPPDAPLVLFDAARDGDALIVPYGGYARFEGAAIAPGRDGAPVLRLDGHAMAKAEHKDIPAQFAWNGTLDLVGRNPTLLDTLVVSGRSAGPAAGQVMVILIERDGAAWGKLATLTRAGDQARLPLAEFKLLQAAMLPRDFPVGINPYWLRAPRTGAERQQVSLVDLQAVQCTLGARFLGSATPVIDISRIYVEASGRSISTAT